MEKTVIVAGQPVRMTSRDGITWFSQPTVVKTDVPMPIRTVESSFHFPQGPKPMTKIGPNKYMRKQESEQSLKKKFLASEDAVRTHNLYSLFNAGDRNCKPITPEGVNAEDVAIEALKRAMRDCPVCSMIEHSCPRHNPNFKYPSPPIAWGLYWYQSLGG